MVFLNDILVNIDTFVDRKLMNKFDEEFKKVTEHYSFQDPYIKWSREYEGCDVLCVACVLEYLHRRKYSRVQLAEFTQTGYWALPIMLNIGNIANHKGCSWKMIGCHIIDETEYVGNRVMTRYTLEGIYDSLR